MEIIWTEEASSNLNDIFHYIAQENIRAAEETIDGIYNKVQLLVEQANIGYIYKKNNYKIIRIFHGSMDIKNYL